MTKIIIFVHKIKKNNNNSYDDDNDDRQIRYTMQEKGGGGETYLEVRLEYSMGNDDDKEYLEYSIA